MRKVTQQIKDAFDARQERRIGNTYTDGQSVWLHDNMIVDRRGSDIYASLAGWNTPTTRERVNGITNAGFHQVNFEALLNGEPVDVHAWIKITD